MSKFRIWMAVLACVLFLAGCSGSASDDDGTTTTGWGGLYGISPVVAVAYHPTSYVTFAAPSELGFRYWNGSGWYHYLTHNSLVRSNHVRDFAIDNNGILWIATDMGVSRFNGSAFASFTHSNTSGGLISDNVYSLCLDSSGAMWVGTDSGASLYNATTGWQSLTTGLSSLTIKSMAVDNAGNVWFGHDGAGVTRLRNGGGYDYYSTSNGMANGDVTGMDVDSSGDVWLATPSGLHRFNGSTFTIYTTASGLPSSVVRDVAVDAADGVWVATNAGIAYRWTGSWTTYTTASGLSSDDTYSLAVETSSTAVWVGTAAGVDRFQGPSSWNSYGLSNANLPSNHVNDVAVDASGYTWFASNGGLTRYTGSSWTTWDSSVSSLPSDGTRCVLPFDNVIWVATNAGLFEFDGSAWATHDQTSGDLPSNTVQDLCADGTDLWIATTGGLVKRDSANTFTIYTTADGLGSNDVRGVAVDDSGVVWAATAGGLSTHDGASWSNIDTGSAATMPADLCTDVACVHGGVWIGTNGHGVAFYDGTAFTVHDASQDKLPSDTIVSLSEGTAKLYVSTPAGYAEFDGSTWTYYNEFNSPLINDDVNVVRLLSSGAAYVCTAGGVSVVK